MRFPVKKFENFCRYLTVDSKESGPVPLRMMGSQRYFLNEVVRGLSEDKHTFICLKGRQLGISTISLALDLFWLMRNEGMQGSVVTDDETNRDQFRATLKHYHAGLPYDLRVSIEEHNRNQLIFGNRSRIHYTIAGKTRANPSLGQGKGINFLHATEVSTWASQQALASLVASLAQRNPLRLYIFESTAAGFNEWREIWKTAKISATQHPIFIAWWRNEKYSVDHDHPYWETYWDGILDTEEKEWIAEVKELYDYDITAEQMAWWRGTLAEEQRDLGSMYQNYPPSENYAFVSTGIRYFSNAIITEDFKRLEDAPPPVMSGKYDVGQEYDELRLKQVDPEHADLKIWEMPSPHGIYAIGGDPAYGSSEWADQFVAQVVRCYSDRLVQVAEFCTPYSHPFEFAWILCHLAGSYNQGVLNVELNGPGEAVLMEIQNLQRKAGAFSQLPSIYEPVLAIQHYFYRRPDAVTGAPSAIHWKSTGQTKERAMGMLKDWYERRLLILNSIEAVEEFRNVSRIEGSISIEAPGRDKDDRCMAMAQAIIAYNDTIMPNIYGSWESFTYANQKGLEASMRKQSIHSQAEHMVFSYLKAINDKAAAQDGR